MNDTDYAGFWIRVGASIIDTLMLMVVVMPVLLMIYGKAYLESEQMYHGVWDLLLSYVFPAIVVILFWIYKSATPGKMMLGLKIVDAETGEAVPTGRLIGRYFGYFVASIPLLIGIIWVGFDKKKQGWHDKLAGTVVVKASATPSQPTIEA